MTDVTRRGALAFLGALAGCGAANPLDSSEPTELDAAAVRALADGDAPVIPERLLVDIGQSHLAASERRARTLLDAVPASLGPDEIPNGAIRQRVQHPRDAAAETLAAASERPSPFERLDAVGDSRADTRFAAAAWRAIDAGLTRQDLSEEAATVREDRVALRNRWSYVGGDPVDATLVHAAIERRLDSARANATLGESHRYREGNPLGVGEAGEEIERARVAVDDAAHFYSQFRSALDDPTDLRSRLRDARETLFDAFESERQSVEVSDPDRPWSVDGADTEDTPVARALQDLYRPLHPRREGERFDGGVARALLWVHGSFVDLRGFQSLRERVKAGETFAIESAGDVASLRSAAITALQSANEDPSPLTRATLATLSDRLADADATLASVENGVRPASIRHEAATYLTVMVRAREAPAVSERVASVLRA